MPIPRETAKRKASELAVPAKGEDPAERKRLLNVIAQRRYRQRRKEHVKNLEAKAGGRIDIEEDSPTAIEDQSQEQVTFVEPTTGVLPGSETIIPSLEDFAATDFTFLQEQSHLTDDHLAIFEHGFVTYPKDLEWNPSLPSLPSSPGSTTDPSNLSLTPPSSTSSPIYSFPDQVLQVPELNLLRGAVAVARRLNIEDLIWSLDSTSPFTAPAMALAQFRHLPANLRPTMTQLNMPLSSRL